MVLPTIRVVLADDEPLARMRVRQLLDEEPGVTVVGEAANGSDAIELISRTNPDLVLLDIRMPDFDGLDVLETIEGDRPPLVIFATAYDEYAIRAFELHAIDFLLKPFSAPRFHRAIERARERLELIGSSDAAADAAREQLTRLLADLAGQGRALQRVAVTEDGRTFFLPTEEITWVESVGNYLILHTADGSYRVRGTLKSFESRVDPEAFIKIHRARMVQLSRVREIQQWGKGEFLVILTDGTRVQTGREHGKELKRLMRTFS